MEATVFTSIVLVVFAAVVLAIASWAWFGDWEPRARHVLSAEERASAEVEAFRREIESYERDQRTR